MDKFANLSGSEKIILLGNVIATVGAIVISIGNFFAFMELQQHGRFNVATGNQSFEKTFL